MDFIEEDFSRMRFNPKAVPQGKRLADHYPELKRIFNIDMTFFLEMQFGDGGADRVGKYVCYMYDMHTPLRRIVNYQNRKSTAMRLAGFPIKEGEITEPKLNVSESDMVDYQYSHTPYRDLMHNKSPLTNRMIVMFVRAFRDHDYLHLHAIEATYYRNLEAMMDGNNTANQDKSAMDVVDKTKRQVKEMYEEVYNGKPEKLLVEETMMVMEEDSLGIEPEDIARRLLEGEYITPR